MSNEHGDFLLSYFTASTRTKCHKSVRPAPSPTKKRGEAQGRRPFFSFQLCPPRIRTWFAASTARCAGCQHPPV